MPTCLRMVSALLLQQTLFKDLNLQVKMLTFLKRMKGTRKHSKGRFINFLLCSMNIINPIMALFALMITMGQEKKMGSITKSFVTIGFIMNIDNMFASTLPKEIKDNQVALNKKKIPIGKDYNSYRLIFQRMKKGDTITLLNELFNIWVNIQFTILVNFQIIVINYFAPVIVVVIQVVGYYS